MKRASNLLRMTLLLGSVLLCPALAEAQTFDAVFDLVKQLRQGQDLGVAISVQTDTFTVMREQVSPLTKDKFEALRAGAPGEGPPHLKYLRDTEAIVFPLSATLEVEEHKRRDAGSQTWLKREYVPVATYKSSQWRDFLREALNHGLSAINRYGEDSAITSLDFSPSGPSQIQYSAKSLTLTAEFYEYMRVSPRHATFAGSKGFAVLVHDPHSSRTGRFQLIPGLHKLLSANSGPVIFLNEGEFRGQSRRIGFNTLDQALLPATQAGALEPVVYNLLGRYLIDSPMAYRLIYDRNIPAVAIDESRFLPTSSFGQRPESLIKVNQALRNLLAALDGIESQLPSDSLERLRELVLFAAIYERTELKDVDGRVLVNHFDSMAKSLDHIAQLARLIKQLNPASSVNLDADLLQRQAAAYRGESRNYALALQRDEPMAARIAQQALTATGRLPIAFIGNFHTDGITSYLRKHDIGYVVVEPRHNYPFSDQERQAFDSYLYPTRRNDYLRSATSQNKGAVAPTVVEVQTYYRPFIRREVARIVERERVAARGYRQTPSGELDYPTFSEALKGNGVLANARVEFGGAAPPRVPPEAGTPFAFFEPGDNGSGRFFILDVRDAAWRSERGRYNCVREIKLLPPFVREGLRPQRQVSFYQDGQTRTVYASVFDPQSRRYYLYEGDKAIDTLSSLALPAPSKDKDNLIHMRLAEIERILQRRSARANTRVHASGE